MREVFLVRVDALDAEVVFELDFELIPQWKRTVKALNRSSIKVPPLNDDRLAYAKYVGREILHYAVHGMSDKTITFNLWDNPVFLVNPEAVIIKAKTVRDAWTVKGLEVSRL